MTLLLEPDLSSYSDQALAADLCLLPPQRREKALRYRFPEDRKRCVRAYMLLWDALRAEYGLVEAPVFEYAPRGKPYLRDMPELHFSLSHTGNAVLCALDTKPVGADIEMIRSRDIHSLLRVFSEKEQEQIAKAASPERCFTVLWTRKESFLKLTGEGLTGIREMRSVPTDDTDMLHFETVDREQDGFLYSICQWKTP